MNELTSIESAPMTAKEVRGQVHLIQEIMRDVMRSGEHYGTVPGCGPKPTLLLPGAQKLILTFRLVPDPEITIVELHNGHREVRCKVKLFTRDGIFIGAGVGTCSTLEAKYRFRSGPVEYTDKLVPKEYWDLRGRDPQAAQELLGQGMQARKNKDGIWVCVLKGQPIEHDNPADFYNTVQKMAYKRALVSAALTVTAASDIFTQDIEDMPEAAQQPSADQTEKASTRAANAARVKTMTAQMEPQDATQDRGSAESSTAPVLVASNIIDQFGLCQSIAEWSQVANAWQEESHLHTEEDRRRVREAANRARKMLEKR